jgi:hypothetical protein
VKVRGKEPTRETRKQMDDIDIDVEDIEWGGIG